jgi:O-antigen ligase
VTIEHNKIAIVIGGLVLVITTVCAAYLAESLILLLPVVLISGIFLVQYPAVLFYLLLASIPWSAEYNFTKTLGTDLPDEPLMLLLAFSTTCLLIYKGKKRGATKTPPTLLLLLLLHMGWVFLTVLLSSHFVLSAKYFIAKGWYLLAFVAAPLLLNADEKFIKRSGVILFTSTLAVMLLTLCRHAHYHFVFAKVNDSLKPFFRNHVTYSALLVMMMPLLFCFWQQVKNITLRRAVGFTMVLLVGAVYLSYARGAWLALLTGTVGYWLLRKGWLLKSFTAAVIFTAMAVLWAKNNDRYLAFAHDYKTTVFHQNFDEHLAATYQMKDVSTAERFHRWIAGVRMADDSWLTGFGPSTFYQHYKSYTVPAFKTWVSKNEEQSTVHNYFLLLMVEQGAIGLLLFLSLIGAMFWEAQKIYHRTDNLFWKNVAAAIAAVLVMQCTVNFLSDLIETDKVGSLFYLCIAVLMIADKATRTLNTN